jgi:hypothetical protein
LAVAGKDLGLDLQAAFGKFLEEVRNLGRC